MKGQDSCTPIDIVQAQMRDFRTTQAQVQKTARDCVVTHAGSVTAIERAEQSPDLFW
jgi:S-adenosylhomocysteine hydrolase